MIGLRESLRRVGRYRRIEARLFEILGGWVASVPEPEAKLLLARHSHHHAWRARLWDDHLDVGAGGAFPGAPGDVGADGAEEGLEAFLAVVAGPGAGADPTVGRLAGTHRVVIPRLVAAYRLHLDECSPVADGSVMRSLHLVIGEEERDRVEGEALLGALIDGSRERTARVDLRVEGLEARLAAAGGLVDGFGGAVRRPS